MRYAPLIQSVLAYVVCATGIVPGDKDRDGIEDPLEQAILDRFAPLIRTDEKHAGPEGSTGVPVSVKWFLTKSDPVNFKLAKQPDRVDAFLDALRHTKVDVARSWRLELRGDLENGNRQVHWGTAQSRGDGVWGRVWQPWPKESPDIYSVQYFFFLTYNETKFSGGFGNHDGDWLCIDLGVRLAGSDASSAIVDHAIFHNHGRQLFLLPEAMEFRGSHPIVYLENLTNEPWPNGAPRGDSGWSARRDNGSDLWPARHGFSTNVNFDHVDLDLLKGTLNAFMGLMGRDQATERKVVREHSGHGDQWKTWLIGSGSKIRVRSIPNLGERARDDTAAISLCGPEGLFILQYPGFWGNDASETTVPKGPPFQAKVWNRGYVGPWSLAWGPNRPSMTRGRWHPKGQTSGKGIALHSRRGFLPFPGKAEDLSSIAEVRIAVSKESNKLDHTGTDDDVALMLHAGKTTWKCVLPDEPGDDLVHGEATRFLVKFDKALPKRIDSITLAISGSDGMHVKSVVISGLRFDNKWVSLFECEADGQLVDQGKELKLKARR